VRILTGAKPGFAHCRGIRAYIGMPIPAECAVTRLAPSAQMTTYMTSGNVFSELVGDEIEK